MIEKDIENKMRELPEYLKKEVLDYMEFLLAKHKYRKKEVTKFKFDWEGGLSDIKDRFTSVELQHKASEWR
ncbi:MAG: DUF2281 domain-containing protein [Candidatus Heimdallarchaeum endolithica]|uniref:DUF2281 domain-containing protein n=1 Tax=Candidatus Heimdallarchaeum endolithica TaxID=2876572 RepID=A0A9Y1BSC2_9ARCH|nr:MAG: DUF2281 domain-containing protein [Candidatus Heimdallarchaeum endolithica]